MSFQCEHCFGLFVTIQNLCLHKKTAKYCLALRGEEKACYICEGCDKEFSTITNMKRHQLVCDYMIPNKIQSMLDEKDLELDDKDVEIDNLQKELLKYKKLTANLKKEIVELRNSKELAVINAEKTIYKTEYEYFKAKPAITNNITNNKLKMVNTSTIDPFTLELVNDKLDQFTYEMFMLGEAGVKRFILGMITKDDEKNYVTTDVSRPNFHRYFEKESADITNKKKWVGDKGALFLTNVFSEMKPKVLEHWDKFNIEADKAGSPEENESLDMERERIKPIVLAITGSETSKNRKELLGNVIKYIKPHVAV